MWFDVVLRDGAYGWWESDGEFQPLTSAADVLAGWRAVGVFRSPAGPAVVEFTNDAAVASWFLDADLVRLGGTIWELDEQGKRLFGDAFWPVLARLAEAALGGVEPSSCAAAHGFLRLNSSTRNDLASLVLASGPGAQFVAASEGQVPADLPFLGEALSIDLQEAALTGAANGGLRYVDPSNNQPVSLKHSLLLDDFRFLYPLKCASGRQLFACAAGHYNNFLGLYDHDNATFYAKNVEVATRAFEWVRQSLVVAVALYAAPLSRYLELPSTRLTAFLRPPPSSHLGHQLRDELAGLERLSSLCVTQSDIAVAVPSADRGTEIYGPVDQIFVELAGKVRHWNSDLDFREQAYNEGLCLFRQTYPYVSDSLRQKIRARIERSLELEPDRDRLSRLKGEGRAVVLIGLRVENRTLIGLDEFIRRLLDLLSSMVQCGAVVLDGFNSWGERPDQIYHTNEQKAAKRLPIDVERELASKIVAAAPGNIEVIDLIGASVDRSLFWSFNSDCFFAIWGAGLAKYRWAANRPGYVLSSAWNLKHRSDLRIYDSPEVMEAPTELQFVEPHLVFDRPDAEILNFQHDQEIDSYFNFAVERTGTLASVREFFLRHLPNPRT